MKQLMILANSLKKCASLLSISLGILVVTACNDTSDNNNSNNAQLENQVTQTVTEKNEPQQEPAATVDAPIAIKKSLPEISNTNPGAEPETTDTAPDDIESEQIKTERQLAILQKELNQNSQNNAALRQHIEILIKKVEENQQIIQKFDQKK